MRIGTVAFGREVSIEVSDAVNELGQFSVTLTVDGQGRWTGLEDEAAGPRLRLVDVPQGEVDVPMDPDGHPGIGRGSGYDGRYDPLG